MHALTSTDPQTHSTAAAGGKGRALGRLTSHGFPVPAWAVVGVDAFDAFLDAHGLRGTLAGIVGTATPATAAGAARQARALIESAEVPAQVRSVVAQAYEHVGAGRVAVRSSGVEEDAAAFSFAGQFDSCLNVAGVDRVVDAVRRCWASAFSERSLHYRIRHGLPLRVTGMAVVVQTLVDARTSGVLFTTNPAGGPRDECVISAVYGLGEGLVSGAVDADTMVVDAHTGDVLRTVVGEKQERFHAGEGAGCTVDAVDATDRARPALDPGRTEELRATGMRIATALGGPQDIEWAFDDRQLWILQSRPVTTRRAAASPDAPPGGELRIWDNSNIVESFSGICSPLTFTVAADVYGRVYRGYARSLRVPAAGLRQMDDWLPVMLGYFHGRVYYNLLHWYRMVRLAPGYRLNRRVLEASLGVDEPLDDATADALHPYVLRSVLRGRAARTVSAAAFLWRAVRIDALTDRFVRRFSAAYEAYDGVDHDALPGDEVYRRFQRMEHELIEIWGPMMVLDAILLTEIGLLHLLTRRWLPDAPAWFTPAVAGPGEDVESAEPARALAELAALVRSDAELTRIVTEIPPDRVYQELREAGCAVLLAAVDDYLARYGYRSMDELKLEVPDLHEDPSGLFAMVRSALPQAPAGRRADADAYLDTRLHGPRRFLYEQVRRRTSRGLAHRERLRLCRTRAFGMAKRMLRAMGRDLERVGAIEEFADVFQLRLEELRGCYEGTIGHTEVKPLVALRKTLRAADERLTAPARFTTRGSVYWQGALGRGGWGEEGGPDAAAAGTELHGTPSCPGVVEGRAVVVDGPADAAGGILLAYRTDPGWVPVLPSASALLIERGSPLTHVAVVARELGIPTVVQIKDLIRRVPAGSTVRVDGGTGVVTVLAGPGEPDTATRSEAVAR
ncbi:phosphoenolpyruvate synthase [Streptomyces sp. NPDC002004]